MVYVEEWRETHPRWDELVACIRAETTREYPQERWALHVHPPGEPDVHFLAALCEQDVVGFLKVVEQRIGPADDVPEIWRAGLPITEAKITAFGVRRTHQRQGIGTALQTEAIRLAIDLGCYQVRSQSSIANQANNAVKMKLGFGIVPDFRANRPASVFWVKCLFPE